MNAECVCVCVLFVVRKRIAHCVSASKSSFQIKKCMQKRLLFIQNVDNNKKDGVSILCL